MPGRRRRRAVVAGRQRYSNVAILTTLTLRMLFHLPPRQTDGYVVAEALTDNAVDDADILPDLLGQIDAPLRRFTGDGAHDTGGIYQAVGEAGRTGVEIVVPPRRLATASPKAAGPWEQRNQHIERLAEIGRQAWQNETGCRQQARVEGTFHRYTRTLGGSLRAKGFDAQQRKAMVGCTVLNKMLALGKA